MTNAQLLVAIKLSLNAEEDILDLTEARDKETEGTNEWTALDNKIKAIQDEQPAMTAEVDRLTALQT